MKDEDIRIGIKEGFFDIELLNKIIQFELKHPEIIAKWKKVEEEKRNCSGLHDISQKTTPKVTTSEIISDEKELERIFKGDINELISKCLINNPENRFVLSVKEYYDRYGRISDKQLKVLLEII